MGLEIATTIPQLNANWPLGTDPRSQGDDHLRLVKAVMKNDALSLSAGGTVAGALTLTNAVPLTLSNAAPQLRMVETDIASPAGRYRLAVSTGLFSVNRNTAPAGDFSTVATIASFADEGAAAPATHTVLTREKGDNRYLQQTGGTLTGTIEIANTAPQLRLVETDISSPGGRFRFIGGGGDFLVNRNTAAAGDFSTVATIASFAPEGSAAPAAHTVLTREKGDARYPRAFAFDVAGVSLDTLTQTGFIFWSSSAAPPSAGAPDGAARGGFHVHLDANRAVQLLIRTQGGLQVAARSKDAGVWSAWGVL